MDRRAGASGTWWLARATARGRVGGLVTLLLLTAVTVAVGAGGVAAARRTITAYPRLLDDLATADAWFGVGNPDVPEYGFTDPERFASLPSVAEMGVARGTLGSRVHPDGRLVVPGPDEPPVQLFVALDERMYRTVAEVPLRRGRLPHADEPDAVAISAGAADAFDADVGDEILYTLLTFPQVEAMFASGLDDPRTDDIERLRVVGVFGPTELNGPPDAPASGQLLLGSRALLEAHPGVGTYEVVALRLRDGRDRIEDLREEASAMELGPPEVRPDDERLVHRAVGPEAVAVLLFALTSLLAGAVITAQAAGRHSASAAGEARTLAALGVGRWSRVGAIALPAMLAILAGAALGAVVAVAASGLAPVGLARAFEPDPGPRFDVIVLAVALGVVLVLVLATAALGWRHAASAPAALAHRAPRVGGPLAVRLARSLSSASPTSRRLTRASVTASTVAIVSMVGILIFDASLHRLVTSPRYYGADYDLSVWDGYGVIDDDVITSVLDDQDEIVEIARPLASPGRVDGHATALQGFEGPVVGPVLTAGRFAAADDEVVLGRRLARQIDASIGDEVEVTVDDRTRSYRVVGSGVVPDGVGDGAVFTAGGLRAVAPDAEVGFQYARLDPAGNRDTVRANVLAAFDDCAVDCDVLPPTAPNDVRYLDRVGRLPQLLALVVGVLGVAATVHALVQVSGANRRSLALLKAIGATRSILLRSVVAQASLVSAQAMLLGLPIGWFAGSRVWRLFADELGVVPDAAVPLAVVALLAAGLVAISHVAALLPAQIASRRSATAELRGDR